MAALRSRSGHIHFDLIAHGSVSVYAINIKARAFLDSIEPFDLEFVGPGEHALTID